MKHVVCVVIRVTVRASACALMLAVAGCPPPVEPDPPDPAPILFNPLTPAHIELRIDEAGFAALQADPRTYVEGTFTLTQAERSFEPLVVGVALKGNEAGSFRPLEQKAAFKIKFDAFVRGQRFLGLEGLKLNNMIEDPSQTHEVIAYAVFAHLGIPAARAGYATVTLNDVDYGLHVSIERLDNQWTQQHFASTNHLYEASFPGADLYPGSEGEFDADEGPPAERNDLSALMEVGVTPDDRFFDELRARTRFTDVARTWAASQYLAHWDGYAGAANNYYLHSDDDGIFSLIPSGLDQSLGDPTYDLKSGQSPYSNQGLLFARCRSLPACDASLDDALAALKEDLATFDAVGFFEDVVRAIEPLAAADPRRDVDLETVHAAQSETRRFLLERPAVLP